MKYLLYPASVLFGLIDHGNRLVKLLANIIYFLLATSILIVSPQTMIIITSIMTYFLLGSIAYLLDVDYETVKHL